MARSRAGNSPKRSKRRYLVYGIPLIALAIVAAVTVAYYLPTPPAKPAEAYTFNLLIQAQYPNSQNVSAIAPKYAIGEAGGYWKDNEFDSYGIDSTHYPIYMDTPSVACPAYCIVHVDSRVVHDYTLGDYFNVWGQTLSQNNTIGIKSSGTYNWELCVGISPNSYSSNQWGALPLSPALNVTLFYHDYTGLGCAPS